MSGKRARSIRKAVSKVMPNGEYRQFANGQVIHTKWSVYRRAKKDWTRRG